MAIGEERGLQDITTQGSIVDRGPTQAAAERGFRASVIISGVRCTLAYVVLPFVVPFLGIAPGVGPALGLPIGAVAIVANVLSIRRFWAAQHRWRRQVTVVHIAVIVFLLVLVVTDLATLLT